MHPQLYDHRNTHKINFIIQSYLVNAVHGYIHPETCPASNFGRPCCLVSCNPETLAKLCLDNGLGIEDVVSLAPIWLLDQSGNKIGCRPGPLAIEDYIHAYYAAKNPISVGAQLAKLAGKATMSPKLGPEGRIFSHTDPLADHGSLWNVDVDPVLLRGECGCSSSDNAPKSDETVHTKQEAEMTSIKQESEAEH